MSENVDYACEHCGSRDVRRDAWAAWGVERQCWELAEVFDHEYCHDCGNETSLAEHKL